MKDFLETSIIADIRRIAKKLRKNSLSNREYEEYGNYSIRLIYKKFGRPESLFLKAGLNKHIPRTKKISNELIIKDIQQVTAKLDQQELSYTDYLNYGKYAIGTLERAFGSVSNAVQAAGIEIYSGLSKQELLEDLKNTAKKLNQKSITGDQYSKYGKHSESSLRKKFNMSWAEICQLAKLDPHIPDKKRFSDEELLHYLRRYYNINGYVPSKRDIANNSYYPSDKAYYSRFKTSWMNIIKLAGLTPTYRFCGIDGEWYDSKEECYLANKLYSNFVDYEPHKRICAERQWVCDFYFHNQNLWLEYDGLGQSRREKQKFDQKIKYYRDNNFNFKVLLPKQDILKLINAYIKIDSININNLSFNVANEFAQRVHYLGNIPRGSKYKLGCFVDNLLVGIAIFGKTANIYEQGLALTRFAYIDRVRTDTNFGSRFMSQALKYLKSIGEKGKIYSWSDPRFHDGALYKACNFRQINVKKFNDYIYIDKIGNEYHKSVCRVPAGQSESEEAARRGLKKIVVPNKQKWVFDLTR